MTYTEIVQKKVRGEVRILGLALANRHLKMEPTSHTGPCDRTNWRAWCSSCFFCIFLENRFPDDRLPRLTWSPELFVDFAAELVQRDFPLDKARFYAAYMIPTIVNHLMPRRYRWVWEGTTGRTVSSLDSSDQRVLYKRLLAAGEVDPFWDEPIVLPQSVRLSREASASHSIWPPRDVPSPAELVPVFGGVA